MTDKLLVVARSFTSNLTIVWLLAQFVLLSSMASPGADHFMYGLWSKAAIRGDIGLLGLIEDHCIPFHQWAATPGLMAALPSLAIPSTKAWVYVGIICSLAFWVAFYRGMDLIHGRWVAFIGCQACFVATPVGYYSQFIGIETYALFPAGILFYETVKLVKGVSCRPLSIAIAAALLVMIRPYLLPYAFPAYYLLLFRDRSHPIGIAAKVGCLSLITFFLGVAIAVVATNNYWMTGNGLKSPYSFSDGEFMSLNPTCPNLYFVLMDPLNGMCTSHPIYLIAVPAMFILINSRVYKNQIKTLALVVFLAITFNIYIQGCWYYWWLGKVFGMRGCILASIPVVTLAVGLMNTQQTSGKVVVLLATGSSIWSALLLFNGDTFYLNWSEFLFGVQYSVYERLFSIDIVFLVVGSLLTFWLWPRKDGRVGPALMYFGCLLNGISSSYLAHLMFHKTLDPSVFYGLILVLVTLAVLVHLSDLRMIPDLSLLAYFFSVLFLFLCIANNVYQNDLIPSRQKFDRSQVELAYGVLRREPRFNAQADEIRRFLEQIPVGKD